MNSKLIHSKLSSVDENNQGSASELEETSFSEFINNYNSSLRHCNSVDWMDVVKSMHKEIKTNLELQNYIQGSGFLVLNPTDDLVEVSNACKYISNVRLLGYAHFFQMVCVSFQIHTYINTYSHNKAMVMFM